MKARKQLLWICALACVMDAGTGALLIAAPRLILVLMGLESQFESLPYLRFIGAFVFSIGSLYGVAWRYLRQRRLLEWRALWLATAWARLCVGCTVLGLIALGELSPLWVSVPVVDLALGVFQLGYLKIARRGNA